MKKLLSLTVALLALAILSSGCAYTPMMATMGARASQHDALKPYAIAKNEIPSLPLGYTRIFVYRPQAFLGMNGTAVVIIDGKWMGDANHSFDNNLLLPGAVFVVDTPADVARAGGIRGGRAKKRTRFFHCGKRRDAHGT